MRKSFEFLYTMSVSVISAIRSKELETESAELKEHISKFFDENKFFDEKAKQFENAFPNILYKKLFSHISDESYEAELSKFFDETSKEFVSHVKVQLDIYLGNKISKRVTEQRLERQSRFLADKQKEVDKERAYLLAVKFKLGLMKDELKKEKTRLEEQKSLIDSVNLDDFVESDESDESDVSE